MREDPWTARINIFNLKEYRNLDRGTNFFRSHSVRECKVPEKKIS